MRFCCVALLALAQPAAGCHWIASHEAAGADGHVDLIEADTSAPWDGALDGPLDAGSPETPIDSAEAHDDLADAFSTDTANVSPNIAFVSSTVVQPWTLGSVAAADAICAGLASAEGLPGTYRAWLSSSTQAAPDRLAGASGWVRRDGKPVALTLADLIAGRVLYPIRVDEKGHVYDNTASFPYAITGTLGTGAASSDNCGDWTDEMQSYTSGSIHGSGHLFTSFYGPLDCSSSARLYCFGIDAKGTVPLVSQTGRVAFLSKGAWTPDSGGIASADSLCQAEAKAVGLSGTFLALLATSTATAASRLTLVSASKWVRPDGLPLAPTALAAMTSPLEIGITLHADGNHAAAPSGDNAFYQSVWIGALDPQSLAIQDCQDWVSGGINDLGTVAKAGMTNSWAYFFGSSACSDARQLYCFQN